MFEKADQANRAIRAVLDITNAFLVASATRDERIRADVDVRDGPLYESKNELVEPASHHNEASYRY